MTCVPCFLVLAPPYLAPGSSKPNTPTYISLRVLFLIPHVKALEAHAIACGGLSLVGDWLVRVGVGAPCLGGGLPSLSLSLL